MSLDYSHLLYSTDARYRDWKKLTFFYFADSYINFNPLVTDLFKIYKTRIWMSAINTAAIGSPAGAHNMLGGQTNCNYSPELDDLLNRRQGMHNQDTSSVGSTQPPLADHSWTQGREIGAVGGMSYPQPYNQQFQQSPGYDVRHISQYPMAQYGQVAGSIPSVSSNIPMLHNAASFTSQPDNRSTNNQDRQDPNRDWNQVFQGLSLSQ